MSDHVCGFDCEHTPACCPVGKGSFPTWDSQRALEERVTELEGLLREAHAALTGRKPVLQPEYLDRIERAMDPDRLTFAERGSVSYLGLTQRPEAGR